MASLLSRPRCRWCLSIAVIGSAMATVAVWGARTIPHHLLRAEAGAEWILPDVPVSLRARERGEAVAVFRTFLELDAPVPDAVLYLRVLGWAEVFVGDTSLGGFGSADSGPDQVHRVAIGEHLGAGRQELAIVVRNDDGPIAILAHSARLGLRSGEHWQAYVGQGWRAPRRAGRTPLPALAREFPTAASAFASRAWLFVLLLGVGFAVSVVRGKPAWVARARSVVSSGRVRWLLIVSWVALAITNVLRVPPEVGFDVPAHLDYIRFVHAYGRLPLATDGWQMFQTPLYYMLSAFFYGAVSAAAKAELLLRLVPLVCGVAQIEIAWRATRHVFGERDDLRTIATVFAGVLPMNLYISQYVGNEPMAGALAATAILLLLGMLALPERLRSPRRQIALGVVLGLAILTKVTAILLVPLVAGFLVVARHRAGGRWWPPLLRFGGAVLLVSGWFFARNWIELGRPLVFSSADVPWWQDPGYRVPEHFLRFGTALVHPLFAGAAGVWDGLYSTFWLDGQSSSMVTHADRPPWNYSFVLASAWAALPVAGLAGVGAITGLRRRSPALVLAVLACGLYTIAILQQALVLPIYSTGKATYTLGLLPLYAILVAAGAQRCGRGRVRRALVHGAFLAWAVFAFVGYVVV